MQIVPLLWMHMFDKKLPAVVEEEQLRKNNSELSIDDKPTFTKKLQGGCYLLVLLDLLMWNEGPRG